MAPFVGGLVGGVCLLFENSTGCLFKSQCQIGKFIDSPVRELILATFVARTSDSSDRGFLLESLILAQDERWRRA